MDKQREAFEAWFAGYCQNLPDPRDFECVKDSKDTLYLAWQAAASQWQTIETAPKDFVTEFDGWNGERVVDICWAHPCNSPQGYYAFCKSAYEVGYGQYWEEVKNLTHRMEIPPPPTE